jgi:tRNA A37 threonylcarbamoyladenosine dehydratase
MKRFERTELLLGRAAFEKLLAARVTVCGLGAVGSYAVEALARAGIGRITLIDFDKIKPSNFNRQLYALESTVGKFKADVAQMRIRDINPACVVEVKKVFIEGATVDGLLADAPHAVIDAIDSLSPKVILISACVKKGLFLVSSLGAASRMDPSCVRAGDISETRNCPLGRMIRKKLHRLGIYKGVRCVYSLERASGNTHVCAPEKEEFDRGRPRRPIGSISYMTGIFGLMAAGEVIRYIISKESPQ